MALASSLFFTCAARPSVPPPTSLPLVGVPAPSAAVIAELVPDGTHVFKGDAVAELRTPERDMAYALRAPIDGIVVHRAIGIGRPIGPGSVVVAMIPDARAPRF
jgi:predicted deacylase